MKIVIAGDWHRDVRHAKAVIHTAAENGLSTVLHVGDLGVFWPVFDVDTLRRLPERTRGFTSMLSEAVAEAGIDFRFVDGNHDNHDFLDGLHEGSREAVTVDGLNYQPRGSRMELGGRSFGFLGGAGSIDRELRMPGEDWWAQEEITSADVAALGEDSLDVLIAHEAPSGVPTAKYFPVPLQLELDMQVSRDHLRTAVEKTEPSLVFCGHWHQRLTHELFLQPGTGASTVVHVLDREHRTGNAVVLDTTDLSVVPFIIPDRAFK